jgi:hypothetical protein
MAEQKFIKCTYCDDWYDTFLGNNPVCMKCLDEQLDANLDKIDHSPKIIIHIN